MNSSLIKIFILVATLSGCASAPSFDRTGFEYGQVYVFDNPKKSKNLYVKFLPKTSEKQELIFTYKEKGTNTSDFKKGDKGTFYQDWYSIFKSEISFRYSQEGHFKMLAPSHPYFVSGSFREGVSEFRYVLDYNKAKKVDF